MGRLSTITVLLTLGAWGTGAVSAYQDGVSTSATPSSRPPAPVPPVDYLRAGSQLFNNGQYEMAAKYLKAADDYRDQLDPAQQSRLDEYLAAMRQVQVVPSSAPAYSEPVQASTGGEFGSPGALKAEAQGLLQQARSALSAGRVDEAVQLARQADSMNAPFAASEDSPARLLSEAQTMGRGYPVETKSSARWLLRGARDDIARGDYEAAQAKVDEARTMDVRWGLFDDTPEKVQKMLDEVKPQDELTAAVGGAAPPEGRREKKAAAKSRLKEARLALDSNQISQAEAIASEVATWDVHFSVLEDSPDKVLAAARALRRRDGLRELPADVQPSQSTYDLLVQEARALMASGQFEEAANKARHAMSLNVVPPVTADRAESVLTDIDVLRRQRDNITLTSATQEVAEPAAGEPAFIALEREADRLLAQGQHEEAANKFAEAERLRAQALGSPLPVAPAPAAVPSMPTPDATFPGQAEPEPIAATATFNPQIVVPGLDNAQAEPVPPGTDPSLHAIEQARSLFASGNYAAAKEAATRAKEAGANPAETDELLTQVGLAEQAAAMRLFDTAVAAVRNQEFDRARALLNEVAAMTDALDESMAQRVQDLLLKLPAEGSDAKAPVEVAMDAQALKAQQMNAEVGTKVAEARRLLETDPDKAIATLQQTIDAVKAAGLSEPVTKTMVRRLEVAIELARKDKITFDAKMQDKTAREELERTKLRILEADTAKQKQVSELMEKAIQSEADGDFAQAEMLAKRVSAIDPNNVAAVALATTSRAQRNYERYKRNEDAKEAGFLAAMHDVDESAIVDETVLERGVSYPKTFSELTKNRARFASVEPYKEPETLEVERRLNEPITLDMENSTLGEAIDFIRNYTGLNVVLDMKALQDEALTRDAPVSLSGQDMKLKTALKYMLEPHGLTFKADEGVLVITTPQSRGRTFVRVYQVTDLLMSPKSANVSLGNYGGQAITTMDTNLTGQAQVDGAVQPAGLGGITQGPNTAGGTTSAVNTSGPRVTYSERDVDFGPLIQLITTTIAPNTWEIVDPSTGQGTPTGIGLGGGFGAGGEGGLAGGDEPPIGSITPFILNISLIIRHTAEVHDDIVDLLRQLRRLQDLQVSVEVRFITVNDDFFEAIGVDFDFAIQSDLYGPKSSFVVPNPAATPVAPGPGGGGGGGGGGGAGTFTPPFLVNPNRWYSLGNRQPVVAGVGSNGGADYTQRATGDLNIPFLQDSVTPALGLLNIVPGAGANFGLAFLSDLEVYLFLTALQGNTRSNVVQAPKVTTFNGAAATILDVTTQNFVTSLTPVVNAGAVAFQPQVSTIPNGVTLNVTPVVTADRRYVRLSLAPFFTVIQGVDTFSFGAGAVGGGGLGGGAANLSSTLQLPIISTTAVITTVTVPDGGTVLLGGVKRLTEQRLEYGTPILSKTPLINRLFRNIGIGRTTDSVMLMVTPRIIILEEEEERLGIPAVPVPGLP